MGDALPDRRAFCQMADKDQLDAMVLLKALAHFPFEVSVAGFSGGDQDCH